MIALRPERFTSYGFGSFLEDIEEGEISISPDALETLADAPYRHGLNGLTIFSKTTLAWASLSPDFTVSPRDVSVAARAYAWLSELAKVE